VTGKVAEGIVRSQRHAKKPFFVWWAPAAPHREDVATTLMGRPGRDPLPPARYKKLAATFRLPRTASFNEPDMTDKAKILQDRAPRLTKKQIAQLQLDYEGRMASLRAVDDHVKHLVSILRSTHQLSNTTIVFVSDNGWLQGQHRIPGDKFLPYEESLRVPFIVRGPGVPKGRTARGGISNIDFAPTLVQLARAKAGRMMDGRSLVSRWKHPKGDPDRAIEIEAPRPLFEQNVPVNAWDRPWKGVRTNRYTYVLWLESKEVELYDRRKDPAELHNVAGKPAYAKVRARMAAKLKKLEACHGASCRRVTP
jgi:arylsulfatase A-like enzyme